MKDDKVSITEELIGIISNEDIPTIDELVDTIKDELVKAKVDIDTYGKICDLLEQIKRRN